MKKLLLVTALVLALAVPALAAPPSQMNYGCGLGATVFKDGQANDSLLLQLVATFLNGLCGNGTFGITSGTSDCAPAKKTVSIDRLNEFAYRNLDDLARDIAAGKGETVTTVADLLNVPVESRPAFYRNLQARFTEIFPNPTVETAHVVDAITTIAAQG
ncbi:MAG: DUF3015 domain-containing protein [Deltaproteobacteria bacterium]|uniref:DUF3015 family protein n=1 Tax=Candidatus Deferrimicrobium sp. TaxID=3060586 RepID=UPI00272C419A|nr:DUF3015 family protein [Candidatus Deferrimicrobium sp.]MCR4310182.1 DUF3015 domain-containing protein [Deltaproteobacteria bacterium]